MRSFRFIPTLLVLALSVHLVFAQSKSSAVSQPKDTISVSVATMPVEEVRSLKNLASKFWAYCPGFLRRVSPRS
jgi:hypothetical protein